MDGELTPGVRDGVGIRTELKKQAEREKKNTRLAYGQQDCAAQALSSNETKVLERSIARGRRHCRHGESMRDLIYLDDWPVIAVVLPVNQRETESALCAFLGFFFFFAWVCDRRASI